MINVERDCNDLGSRYFREKLDTVHMRIGPLYLMAYKDEHQIVNDLAHSNSADEAAIRSGDSDRACKSLERRAKLEGELKEIRAVIKCLHTIFDAIESLDCETSPGDAEFSAASQNKFRA